MAQILSLIFKDKELCQKQANSRHGVQFATICCVSFDCNTVALRKTKANVILGLCKPL